jgi:polyamine oxidase
MHQNLRANVRRLFFAGEHTSAEYFGFLQGAWFEGREAGSRIAGLVGRECLIREEGCQYRFYGEEDGSEELHGTTEREEWDSGNGIWADPFFFAGDDEE